MFETLYHDFVTRGETRTNAIRRSIGNVSIEALLRAESSPAVAGPIENSASPAVRVDVTAGAAGMEDAIRMAARMGVTDLGLHLSQKLDLDRVAVVFPFEITDIRLHLVSTLGRLADDIERQLEGRQFADGSTLRSDSGETLRIAGLRSVCIADAADNTSGVDRHGIRAMTAALIRFLSTDELNVGPGFLHFRVTPNGQLYDDVARLRALRIVAGGIIRRLQREPTAVVIDLGSEVGPATDDLSLIDATACYVAGMLGRADTVSFAPVGGSHAAEAVARLAGMQHVISKETGFAKYADLISGSYYVEQLTIEFALDALKHVDMEDIGCFNERDRPRYRHTRFLADAGTPPYLRGPYATMYNGRPWTIRQYAGFSTAEESNAFYRRNLAAGQRGLSVAFDLPTHRGYDSDHNRVIGDVGKAGVAIDTVEDMKLLFDGIPLDRMSVSMTMNGAVLPVLAFYIVAAEEQGVAPGDLRGTIQNDILKEFMVRNTYIYPPAPSMQIVRDVIRFASERMPLFNPVSISGYHMQEAGATPGQELGFTLANGIEYIRAGLAAGLAVDDFAPRLSFFFGTGMDFASEVAKLRAARWLWADVVRSFDSKNPRSLMLRTHCQTSGWSLCAVDLSNNVARTWIEALAAVAGHTQSLHTNALDEAVALPTDHTALVARESQLRLQADASIIHAVDPFGGADRIEQLTVEIAEEAAALVNEVEEAGGMIRAIERGIPKRRIEESAARRQAAIDTGDEPVVGVNVFASGTNSFPDILEVDNTAVRRSQIDRLQHVKRQRDAGRVRQALEQVANAAAEGSGFVEACIDAARARATVGEISYALESVFGRHEANAGMVSGIYGHGATGDERFDEARRRTEGFRRKTGRSPRILMAKLGQDGHDRGARVVASALADLGFDVDVGPLFQLPDEAARQAVDNDVHVLGISSLAGAHKTLVPAARQALSKLGRPDIRVAVGGVIPAQDHAELENAGVDAIFGPGAVVADVAIRILDLLEATLAT